MTLVKVAKAKAALHITMQFRTKRGMAYEFADEKSRLTLWISPRANVEDLGEWCVEAATNEGRDVPPVAVAEWGPTRAAALGALGLSWAQKASALALPRLDWDAVAAALTAVRAL